MASAEGRGRRSGIDGEPGVHMAVGTMGNAAHSPIGRWFGGNTVLDMEIWSCQGADGGKPKEWAPSGDAWSED